MQMFDTSEGFDHDGDSLFGSPPPSPARGRSPFLALPSSSSSANQNVGTIALPGSHQFIELPPAILSAPSTSRDVSNGGTPFSPTPMPALPPRPLSSPKKKKKRVVQSTPRLAPPPINLPAPNEPLPRNFLRNQQALLGLAGLVGGVNPAQLSAHRTRGSNYRNPIVVEDIDDANAPRLGHGFRTPSVDPSRLPPPSSDDIVAALVKQKNVFPVIQSLLSLLGATRPSAPIPTPEPQRTGFERSSTGEPPAKKRKKVSQVPAGAADWDVPYPFRNGEGPKAYQTTWERERGKQLITQLVSLVKGAAHKAATKTFVQQQKQQRRALGLDPEEQKVNGHYRVSTMGPGYGGTAESTPAPAPASETGTATEMGGFSDISNGNNAVRASPYDFGSDCTGDSPTTPFDQLIASLLANVTPEELEAASAAGPSTPHHHQGPESTSQFENWLDVLEAYPPPEGQDDTSAPVSFGTTSEVADNTQSHIRIQDSPFPDFGSPVPDYDFAIDPALLALSIPNTKSPTTSNVPVPMPTVTIPAHRMDMDMPTPGLVESPLASTSSFMDLPTPDYGGTSVEPDIASCPDEEEPITAANTLLQLAASSLSSSAKTVTEPTPVVCTATPVPSFGGAAPSTLAMQSVPAPPPGMAMRNSVAGPGRPALAVPKTTEKRAILARARERRRQLAVELARANVELWETTIEQGVLVNLLKDPEVV